ncbi:hypothetical protein D9756_002032 [Leucocoprinus leucothites]|uniref:Uncharacterized protein n=1 Tax=Leucocoprinus leucothites TaxID=201217 RepID=A0A8H5GBJ8_9AGAR|nr:hypothetical protein D9756_002032 [Leucoagaricus leucothites]
MNGGNVLGNGTWLNVGGNQAVTYGGAQAASQSGGLPYNDPDGRRSMLNPCDDGKCEWGLSHAHTDERWYPTLETLEDGTMIIVGGCHWGGYVNDPSQNNPTYEFFPPRANWATIILDYKVGAEIALDPMPDAVRTYPASAGTVVLPMTPANNWTATILFCGGSNVTTPQWSDPNFIAIKEKASTSCVKITPDVSPSYQHDDPLPDGRTMANFVLLPDGTVFCTNGAKFGTAGYGNNSWAVGQSYADDPQLMPLVFNASASQGERWSSQGFSQSEIPRLYHSSALLLPDGSVLIAGSNPNSDYATDGVKYPTQYKVERFYPSYYNARRPEPQGLPTQLSYGGSSFMITLTMDDLRGDISNIAKTKVVVIRPGFSTHSMNMGQRYVELESTYGATPDKNGFLRVSQMPPNPAIMAPGPALLFVVVNGVPSVGIQIMVGSGKLGRQQVLALEPLPEPAMPKWTQDFKTSSAGRSIQDIVDTLTMGLSAALAISMAMVEGWLVMSVGNGELFHLNVYPTYSTCEYIIPQSIIYPIQRASGDNLSRSRWIFRFGSNHHRGSSAYLNPFAKIVRDAQTSSPRPTGRLTEGIPRKDRQSYENSLQTPQRQHRLLQTPKRDKGSTLAPYINLLRGSGANVTPVHQSQLRSHEFQQPTTPQQPSSSPPPIQDQWVEGEVTSAVPSQDKPGLLDSSVSDDNAFEELKGAHETVAEQNKQIQALRYQIITLKNARSTIVREHAQMSRELETMRVKMGENSARIGSLQSQLERSAAATNAKVQELTKMGDVVRVKEEENLHFVERLEQASKEKESFKAAYNQEVVKGEGLTAKVVDANRRIQELVKAYGTLEKNLQELGDSYNAYRRATDDALNDVKQVKILASATANEISKHDTGKLLRDARITLIEVKDELFESQRVNDFYRDKLHVTTTQLAEVTTRVRELETEKGEVWGRTVQSASDNAKLREALVASEERAFESVTRIRSLEEHGIALLAQSAELEAK